MNSSRRFALALLVLATPPALGQPIVIGADDGAVYDGVLDGFPMIAAPDGVPDFGGNALGIALKTGATEERGIAEFPLGALDGIPPGDVARATLAFNIDDVLGTFGPGTEFTGAACEEILVHVYAGDGAIQLADFLAVDRAPHLVDTRPHGRITDASLRGSGLLVFEVDLTDDLRALLAAGAPAAGIVWRTMDTPTGTSLDNLGDGAAGPPGVNGSSMPYLGIEIGAAATATPTATARPDTPAPTGTPPPDGDATPSPTRPAGSCPGDCDGDGRVAVSELISGVNLALGSAAQISETGCAAMDGDGDGTVRIAELVAAVAAALNGC